MGGSQPSQEVGEECVQGAGGTGSPWKPRVGGQPGLGGGNF